MAITSLIVPGLGQIICGQDNKGAFLIEVALLGHWLTGGISTLLLGPVMSLDAWLIAARLNRGHALGRWEFFPGITRLNRLPARAVPISIVTLVLVITLARIVAYGWDYRPGE